VKYGVAQKEKAGLNNQAGLNSVNVGYYLRITFHSPVRPVKMPGPLAIPEGSKSVSSN
jgi:hypothetical protein